VDSQFNLAGRYGSGAHQGVTAQALSDTAGNLAFQNYGNERTNQLKASMLAPQAAGQDYLDISALGDVGAQRESLAQADINEQIQRFDYDQQKQLNELDAYMRLIGGNWGGSQSGTTTGPALPGPDRFGQILGGGLGLAGLGLQAASLFGWSDRRLKTDIRRVGATFGGLHVYTFRFKSGGPVQMGVMAQEVERTIPDAVHEVDGYLTVDYARIN
jgi:hypothetical protein